LLCVVGRVIGSLIEKATVAGCQLPVADGECHNGAVSYTS